MKKIYLLISVAFISIVIIGFVIAATSSNVVTGSYEITLTDNELAYVQKEMQERGITKDQLVSIIIQQRLKQEYRDSLVEKVEQKISRIDSINATILQGKLNNCLNIEMSLEQLENEDTRIEHMDRLFDKLHTEEIQIERLENFISCVGG